MNKNMKRKKVNSLDKPGRMAAVGGALGAIKANESLESTDMPSEELLADIEPIADDEAVDEVIDVAVEHSPSVEHQIPAHELVSESDLIANDDEVTAFGEDEQSEDETSSEFYEEPVISNEETYAVVDIDPEDIDAPDVIEVYDVGTVEINGEEVVAAVTEINGEQTLVFDMDGDGMMDYAETNYGIDNVEGYEIGVSDLEYIANEDGTEYLDPDDDLIDSDTAYAFIDDDFMSDMDDMTDFA